VPRPPLGPELTQRRRGGFANSSAATFQNFAQIQGETLGKIVLQKIWGLFTTVNFGAAVVGVSIGQYSRASTVSIRTVMAKRDVNAISSA